MSTHVLSAADTHAIVRGVGLNTIMDQLVERLEAAFVDYDPSLTDVPVRDGFHYERPVPGLLEWMPIRSAERTTLKIVAYHPSNPTRRGLPSVLSTISAYETGTGRLSGVMDGTLPTALRTGAASAVATRVLAAPDARVLGLIGCGTQAVAQAHAMSRVLPLRKILAYDVDKDVLRSFRSRVAFLGVEIEPAEIDDIVGASDVLCTATSIAPGAGPVFRDRTTRPWLHVNAVGSDFPGKTELPRTLLERSFVTADFPAQAVAEGECQQLSASEIGPALTEVIRQPDRFRRYRDSTSVFDSTGWALEDQAVMELFTGHARALGLGTEIEIESVSPDPHDPYRFLTSESSEGDVAA